MHLNIHDRVALEKAAIPLPCVDVSLWDKYKGNAMGQEKLTQARLKRLLHYEPSTGVFTWLVNRGGGIKKGDVAGGLNNYGYTYIGVDYKKYSASRLAVLYVEGYFPEHEVDHLDRNPKNNKWDNLKEVSRQCNNRNRGIDKRNTSGITGVYWHKGREKWHVQVRSNNKSYHIGYFKSIIKAAKARWDAEKKHNYPNCATTSSAYCYLKKMELAA